MEKVRKKTKNWINTNHSINNNTNNKRDDKMKVNHKPYKNTIGKGLGQKKITNFKTIEEQQKEITTLEESRYNHYKDLVKEIQKTELEYKQQRGTDSYKHFNKTRIGVDNKYKIIKENIINDYNEKVKPIDTQLRKIRIEYINNNPNKKLSKIDKRMKQ